VLFVLRAKRGGGGGRGKGTMSHGPDCRENYNADSTRTSSVRFVNIYVHSCIYTYVHVYTYETRRHIVNHGHIYIYIRVCIYMYIYICLHIYIHL